MRISKNGRLKQDYIERTYEWRQRAALRKMSYYMERYSNIFDFSWPHDPLMDELIETKKAKMR